MCGICALYLYTMILSVACRTVIDQLHIRISSAHNILNMLAISACVVGSKLAIPCGMLCTSSLHKKTTLHYGFACYTKGIGENSQAYCRVTAMNYLLFMHITMQFLVQPSVNLSANEINLWTAASTK